MDALLSIPREATPAVVFLRSEVPAEHPSASILGQERIGAGVAVAPDRVLTAHYLVMGARELEVTGFDGKSRAVLRKVVDHTTGLALVTLDGPALRPARIEAEHEPRPGMPVFLLTRTRDGERKATTGHVSAVAPFEAFWEYMLDHAIMTTAINPGLAGAPLFDLDGRLLGLVSLGLAAVGRYSLAIPIALYLHRRAEMETKAGPRSGRAWVGFFPQAFDGGVVITGVVDGGPADRAGLSRGDLVLSVDGASVSSLRELYTALWRKAPGQTVGLQVLRESAILVVEVTAGDRDDFYK
ncbi:MAG TPA: S1C family serine protease [Vicinamibacteria bacterium]|nr:S1C family serine protease [Vicinamibacteria bacterium]